MINRLSESLGRIINNPKIVLSLLPAVIGFLPVAGGALMSAPLVDTEAERLKLKPRRRAYINMWFRHTIFPVYPINQPMIAAAALTGVAVPLIILRQIPVVLVMAIVGYIIGFWKTPNIKKNDRSNMEKRTSSYRDFLITFFPILATIIVTVTLDLAGSGLAQLGFDVLIATLIGIIVLTAMSKMNLRTFVKPLKSPAIYGITLAAYGAFLLRKTMVAAGISNIFSTLVTNGSIDIILLLAIAPAILGLLTGSPLGGVSISVSILSGVLTFTPKIVALIYISAYLGYTIAPTHLCFTFTADYFKCSLGQIYRYVIPS
jgi:integral membrane protein (TIGR00529 family)